MKPIKIIAVLCSLFLILTVITGCNNKSETEPSPRTSVSILFIGNSLTGVGDLPKQLTLLSRMYGIDIARTAITPGGAALAGSKAYAIKIMQENEFDYVVMQDLGSPSPEDIKELCDAARENGAQPVLYNPTWITLDGKPDKQAQKHYTAAYEHQAKENDAILANAADAWIYAYDKLSGISLYAEDNLHPSTQGAYFTACVFASTLFDLEIKHTSKENEYNGKKALQLGKAAWEFSSYYKENGVSPEKNVPAPKSTNKKVSD